MNTVSAPLEYHLLDMELRLGLDAVKKMSISKKAQYIARLQLGDMRQLVEMHAAEQARAKKSGRSGNNSQ